MNDRSSCGLWWIPLQAAWGFALVQRRIVQTVRDARSLDRWCAATITRRLTEQATFDLIRLHDGDVSAVWNRCEE